MVVSLHVYESMVGLMYDMSLSFGVTLLNLLSIRICSALSKHSIQIYMRVTLLRIHIVNNRVYTTLVLKYKMELARALSNLLCNPVDRNGHS
jgi:hypothetical protein